MQRTPQQLIAKGFRHNAHELVAILENGSEWVVDTYFKADTASREARSREIATGTTHYVREAKLLAFPTL